MHASLDQFVACFIETRRAQKTCTVLEYVVVYYYRDFYYGIAQIF